MNKTKPDHRGKFIVFEGLDGSGTTTQNHLLAQYLTQQHRQTLHTNEPTQGPVGLMLRLLLSHRLTLPHDTADQEFLSSSQMALLFAADRLDHIQHTIKPKLEEGIHVISDRYYLSSFAYQMGKDRHSLEWLRTINARCLTPDLILFLDTSVAECAKRRKARNPWHSDLFEKNEVLTQVAENYQYVIAVLKQENVPIAVVDGNGGEQAVFAEVIRTIQKYFPEM